MVWLDLGTKPTWLGFGRNGVTGFCCCNHRSIMSSSENGRIDQLLKQLVMTHIYIFCKTVSNSEVSNIVK